MPRKARVRPSMNKDNENLLNIIQGFILEDRKQALTFNQIMKEVFLLYMVTNRIKTFIPEEDLKRFEKMRDNHIEWIRNKK